MYERRRNSKWLPEIFLLLQTVAMLLFSYISYGILLNFNMPKIPLLAIFTLINVFYFIKFHARYIAVKNRTKYMNYN
jgi:hypothetical protein